jgi:hypothetical protein
MDSKQIWAAERVPALKEEEKAKRYIRLHFQTPQELLVFAREVNF